jgi:hypothetical protein
MLLTLLALQQPVFDFEVLSGRGLQVRMAGVPVVRGSWFQYYEPDWSKGHYSSNWNAQKVERVDDNTVQLTFTSPDGRASGSQTYRREGDRLKVHYRFDWAGEKPVKIEASAGMVWAPSIEAGTLLADAKPTRALNTYVYTSQELEPRRFSADASNYAFEAPLGKLSATSSIPLTLFDGRGYRQDWAQGRQLLWLGAMGLDVAKGKPAEFDVEWRLEPRTVAAAAPVTVALKPQPTASALAASERLPLLIPEPRTNRLDFKRPLALTGNYSYPAGRFRFFEEFQTTLKRRFLVPPAAKGAKAILADGGVSKLGFVPGGYRITITPTSITVLGEEDEGLRNGLQRLAQLAFVRNGQIVLPTGTLIDQPSTRWRGVHLFVGPQAVGFHQRLWDRVLRPMGYNKVVLQCERTDWESLPGIKTSETMSKADLARLFAMYRARDVEPIPLIQSFGHMEWLFAHGKNRDIAFNPEVPYAVDPRKPRTQEVLTKLWDEAVDLLKPQNIHFGLDEVDMRGFPDDPKLVTELWQIQLPFLATIAKKHKVGMMLWGDKALAPGEAPDAAHGHNKEEAAKRRAAIPKGSIITDWHYKSDPRPEVFYPSLQLWKREGFTPIASAWYPPENIRGFNLAAVLERAGTLQTTWAGYESNERNMMLNLNQFSAMILAADYAWSGRQEPVGQLGYDPMEVFRRLYFGKPEPVRSVAGTAFGSGKEGKRIGGIWFQTFEPTTLRSAVLAQEGRPSFVSLNTKGAGSSIALALDTAVRAEDGEAVADVVVELAGGKTINQRLLYGQHVRAADDPAPTTFTDRSDRLSAFRIDLGSTPVLVSRVIVKAVSPYAGLRVHGITLW